MTRYRSSAALQKDFEDIHAPLSLLGSSQIADSGFEWRVLAASSWMQYINPRRSVGFELHHYTVLGLLPKMYPKLYMSFALLPFSKYQRSTICFPKIPKNSSFTLE